MSKQPKKPKRVTVARSVAEFGMRIVSVNGRITVNQRLVGGQWVDVTTKPKGTSK